MNTWPEDEVTCSNCGEVFEHDRISEEEPICPKCGR